MIHVKGFAAQSAQSPIAPFSFERRDPGPHDVRIDINTAYERLLKNDVRYRFVIDMASLKDRSNR